MKIFNRVKGQVGENIAKKHLKSQKIKVLEQNYSNYCGEIDIIAKDKSAIVFVEVKERESAAFGRPSEAVDFRKQQKIRRTAEAYLKFNNLENSDVRFDVIEILAGEVNHIKNAF